MTNDSRARVPPTMRGLIYAVADVAPDVLAGAISRPHTPERWTTIEGDELHHDCLPYCGCFIGSLAIAWAERDGDDFGYPGGYWGIWFGAGGDSAFDYVRQKLYALDWVCDPWCAGIVCTTDTEDAAAVEYALDVLDARAHRTQGGRV